MEGDLSVSSLLELKAQVQRKREEVEVAKQGQAQGTNKPKAPSSLAQNRKDVRNPSKRTVNIEESEALIKSHESLARKAKLYEQLQKGEREVAELGNKTQSESILVDFDRKGWDEERKEYKVIEDLYPDDPFEFFSQVYKVADSTKLVEYVDEFGRTRLVKPEEKATLDAEREETMQLFLKLQEESAGPSHYDAGKEVRTKGIGFFKFAQDESERQRQMKALDDLRQNTTEERERYLLQKEQRRIRIKFRLEAIKLRREKFSGGDVKGI